MNRRYEELLQLTMDKLEKNPKILLDDDTTVLSECEEVKLNTDQTDLLRAKFSVLPEMAKAILKFKYCYELTGDDMKDFLDIDEGERQAVFYVKYLSATLGLTEGQVISAYDVAGACGADAESCLNSSAGLSEEPRKSVRCTSGIKAKRFAKIVVSVASTMVLIFSVAFVASADFRENMTKWTVTLYESFASVGHKKEINKSVNMIDKYRMCYIPKNMKCVRTYEITGKKIFRYEAENEENKYVVVCIHSTEISAYLNTENVEFESIRINAIDGKYYEKLYDKYVLFSDGNAYFTIYGTISKEEMIEIAKKIKIIR